MLTGETRRRIKAARGYPLFNAHGATEGGVHAAETSDHMGLFEDNVIFEVVDERYRPVPPGVYGDNVLITVLFSQTGPVIRYELSDSVRLADDTGSRDLPFARIDAIQGRAEDIPRLPGVAGGEMAVHRSPSSTCWFPCPCVAGKWFRKRMDRGYS